MSVVFYFPTASFLPSLFLSLCPPTSPTNRASFQIIAARIWELERRVFRKGDRNQHSPLHGADWLVSEELAGQFERKAGRTKVEGLRLGSAGGGSNGGHETEKGCKGEEGSWGNGGGSEG